MSSRYNISGVDLAEFFPAYEVLDYQFTQFEGSMNFTLTLTKNTSNQTNYMVFTQLYLINTIAFGFPQLSSDTLNQDPPIIYNKTTSAFSVKFRSGSIPFGWGYTAKLWFLVIYMPSSIRPVQSSIGGYQTNGTNININLFPQTRSNSHSVTGGAVGVTTDRPFYTNLTDKNFVGTDYVNLNAFQYDGAGEPPDTVHDTGRVMFYTPEQTTLNYTMTLRSVGVIPPNIINSIAIYKNNIPNNNTTTGYNVVIGGTPYDLTKIFPTCEYFSFGINDNNADITRSYTLTKNTSGTTNYMVFTSYYYASGGSGSTYGPYAASQAAKTLFVYNTTSTGFSLYFNKSTGDIWTGGVRGVIVYY